MSNEDESFASSIDVKNQNNAGIMIPRKSRIVDSSESDVELERYDSDKLSK